MCQLERTTLSNLKLPEKISLLLLGLLCLVRMTATSLYAQWREKLDETAAYRRLKRQNEEMAEEFQQSAKEMIAVRI
jgi:hypothetical protein